MDAVAIRLVTKLIFLFGLVNPQKLALVAELGFTGRKVQSREREREIIGLGLGHDFTNSFRWKKRSITKIRIIFNLLVMQDPRMLPPEEVLNARSRKKKSLMHVAPVFQTQGENLKGVQETFPLSIKTTNKAQKRKLKNEGSPSFQQPERSNSDSSRSGNDYRALRWKYLLVEEESFTLGRELVEVEGEVKALEDEKLTLLDQLVVLEGLVDPSELQPRGAPVS
ncbi:hypothetical protein NE237_023110 [Protea cynaroides]|uniref:Uncharacterized protein n=1 Tax=Protea cynaroides TaxID=273540 RepID=A0A9Q0HAV3_9MAGN|nr:hypothetical protein NE237_023110 [Protea cynaroides]